MKQLTASVDLSWQLIYKASHADRTLLQPFVCRVQTLRLLTTSADLYQLILSTGQLTPVLSAVLTSAFYTYSSVTNTTSKIIQMTYSEFIHMSYDKCYHDLMQQSIQILTYLTIKHRQIQIVLMVWGQESFTFSSFHSWHRLHIKS